MPRRRIKKAKIEFISLVPAGANKLQAVYKSDGTVELSALSKLDEQGELLAVVYAPEHEDSQGDVASAAVIKEAAHEFVANGAKIDIRHDGKPVGAERARVAETFIVHKSDARFQGWKDRDGKDVNLEGAWATVIKIEDPALREKYRNGEWAGVSMGGTAIVESEKSDIGDLVQALKAALTPPAQNPKQDDDMNAEELKKALADTLKESMAELAKALKPEPATPEPKKDEEPVFKGSYDDEKAVRKHSLEVQLHRLRKEVDFSDTDSVNEFLAKSAEIREALGVEEETKKPIRKAGPAANPQKDVELPAWMQVPMSKEDSEAALAGAALADSLMKKEN